MAKDMLEAILSTEEESKARENEAKAEAEKAIAKAKKDAELLIANAEKSACDDAQALFDKAGSDG